METYLRAERAKKKNEKERKSTLANVQEMEQTLAKLTRRIRYVQEDIVKLANYIERNRVMCTNFKEEVYQKWLAKCNAWTKYLKSLSSCTSIDNAYENSSEEKDHIISATWYLIGEQSDRVERILGDI